MTTLEYLQIEALVRGLTVEELMDTYRGTEGEVGEMVAEHDVEWLQSFAEFCYGLRHITEIRH